MTLPILLLLLSQADPALPPGHPPMGDGGVAPSADAIVRRLDAMPGFKNRDLTFEVGASIGRLYASEGRFQDARGYFERALAKAEAPRRWYAQKLRELGGAPPAPSAECAPDDEKTLLVLFTKAKALPSKAAAASCLRAALEPVAELERRTGDTLFLLGESKAAIGQYERSLELFPEQADTRYALGAALLDARGTNAESRSRAVRELKAFLAAAPNSPRAPQAARLVKVAEGPPESALRPEPQPAPRPAPQMPPGAPPAASDESLATFYSQAEAALAAHDFERARQVYLQVMPSHPEDPRMRAGLAWTMLSLNRQPMADRVWQVALESPEAIESLAARLAERGDSAGAQALRARLAADSKKR